MPANYRGFSPGFPRLQLAPIQSEYQRHDETNSRNTGNNHFDDSKFSGECYVLRRREHLESEPRIEVCKELRIAKHQESPSAYPENPNDIEDDVDVFGTHSAANATTRRHSSTLK